MAKVDIKYDKLQDKTHIIVTHKHTTIIVASFDNTTKAYESAKFLTKVFHEIVMDTMDECHKKAIKAIEEFTHEPNSISS